MARVPMVTRTIKGTRITVMCLNVTEAEPFNETVEFPEVFKNADEALKAVKARIDTDEVKAVHIVGSEVFKTLYGMTEEEFLLNAKQLPPRGTKATEVTEG